VSIHSGIIGDGGDSRKRGIGDGEFGVETKGLTATEHGEFGSPLFSNPECKRKHGS
jgi:hypothetical protein